MLAMASPFSTASTPCTRRLHSPLSISKPHTSSLSHISPKYYFFTGRQIHATQNRVAAKAPTSIGRQIHATQNRVAAKTPTSITSTIPGQGAQIYVPEKYLEIFKEIEKLGPILSKKTWYPKAKDHESVKKTWYIVDATDKILGRLASNIAIFIRGKNLPTYTPSVDMGGYVIVVNAEKVAVTGNKRTQKVYKRYSGRPGGLKEETFDDLQKRIPERIIEHAVRGMLPKGRLGRRLFTHLKVYKGPVHPHEAQRPVPLPITDKRMTIEK